MTLHKITEFYTKWFSFFPNIISKFQTTAIFKSSVKENHHSNRSCRYVCAFYCTKVNMSSISTTVNEFFFVKGNVNFNFQPPAIFVFLVFRKSGLIKSCSSSEDLPAYKISWSHANWCKFCIHVRSLNVRHIGIVEGMELKIMTSRLPSVA
jgi:hypothetical protein